MLGLMYKDLYESFCIKKNLIGFITSILLFYSIFFLMPNLYTVLLIVVLSVPMSGVGPIQYSIEQDEISKFDKVLSTLPISKKTIIATKILETYIYILITLLIISIPVILIAIYDFHIIDLSNGLLILFIGIIVSLIELPINNISFMIFGNKKGSIIYLILIITLVIAYIAVHFTIGVDKLLLVPLHNWLLFGTVVAIILNILGYVSCLKIYEHKHS